MRSESTSAFGQPRLTKPTFGARLGDLLAERLMICGERPLGTGEMGARGATTTRWRRPVGKAVSDEKGRGFYHQPAIQSREGRAAAWHGLERPRRGMCGAKTPQGRDSTVPRYRPKNAPGTGQRWSSSNASGSRAAY